MSWDFLMRLDAWQWVEFALILVTLEILFGTSFFLLWLGLSAFVVAAILMLMPGLAAEYQFLIFGSLSVVSLLFWSKQVKRFAGHQTAGTLNRRNEQYVGRIFTLEHPIINRRGKIQVDDSTWKVEASEDLPIGTHVRVIGVDGVILRVERDEP